MKGLEAIANIDYPGRLIIIGKAFNGEVAVLYAITGRSTPSQARKLLRGEKTNTIRTEVTDREQLERGSPALLLYPAIVPVDGFVAVSNGAQTKLIYSAIKNDKILSPPKDILESAFALPFWEYDQKDDRWIDITSYEPDDPNFTPRISGCVINGDAALNIIKRGENENPIKEYFAFHLFEGRGKMISTYTGENVPKGVPLPSFKGAPFDVDLPYSKVEEAVDAVYDALKPKPGQLDFRVSVAGVYAGKEGYKIDIRNRCDK